MKLQKAALLSLAALAATGCVRIGPGQQGVLFKLFGGTQSDFYGEGIHRVWPWDSMYVYDVRVQDGPERLSILASNGLSVGLDVSIRFRPMGSELPALHQDIGPSYYAKIIKPTIRSEIRKIVGQFTPEEIYSTKRQEVETRIIGGIEQALEGRHVEVEAILIRNVELPEKLKIAISEKLEEEQRSEKMVFTLARERQRWKGIEATESLSSSQNAKVVVIGSGSDGLPLILGGN
jgi:regulator of protease activity HflC (stomatin/prohibitin superfamily)